MIVKDDLLFATMQANTGQNRGDYDGSQYRQEQKENAAYPHGSGGGGTGGGLRDIIENGFPETLYDADATKVAWNLFFQSSYIKNVDLPEALKICESAFSNCQNLDSVNLPKVNEIEAYAFMECIQLRQLHIPSVKTIGMNAFRHCFFASINLQNVSCIDRYAFAECNHLEKVDLVKAPSVYDGAFDGCDLLSVIICRDTENVMIAKTTAIMDTPIASGQGFIYIPASMWDAYTAVYGDYMVMFRKIEDYPEICG